MKRAPKYPTHKAETLEVFRKEKRAEGDKRAAEYGRMIRMWLHPTPAPKKNEETK